jgi:RecB family exonuclease
MTLHNNTGEVYTLSNSEIQTFKDCRRKWWLTYYRRLKPKQQKFTGPLALGSRVHEALDQYYSNGTPLLEAHAKLVEADRKLLSADFRDPTDLDSEADLGRIMLEGYLQWVEEEGIDNELEMISTEEILNMPMFDGSVNLTGKIDMRVRRKADGVRMFRDFKTVGGSFSQFYSTAHMNEQILTYMLLENHANGGTEERSEGGIFTLLKKVKRTANAKPPFYDQFEVRHNIFSMRSFWQRLHGTVTDLMKMKTALDEGAAHQAVAYPRPSNDCTWKCPFFSVCPMFDDGSGAEDAITEMFAESDPYEYYGINEKKGSE